MGKFQASIVHGGENMSGFRAVWIVIVAIFLICICCVNVNAQWLPEDMQKVLRTYIPQGVDIPESPLKFYNHTPAFQMNGGLLATSVNPAANPDRGGAAGIAYGNANRDFPWAVTSGLHLSPPSSYRVYKAASIPGPIAYYQGPSRLRHNIFFGNEPTPTVWIYPAGTVFMEFLVNNKTTPQTFEVRKRTKQENGNWVPEIYRPFASVNDLPIMDGLPPHLNPKYKAVSKKVVDGPGQINATVDMIKVPHIDLPPNVEFKKSSLIVTTDEDNNYIPKNFLGNITNCTACHTQVQKHSRVITPDREWYGNVRGSDQIFSFNIFDESSVDFGGFVKPKRFNRGLQLFLINPN